MQLPLDFMDESDLSTGDVVFITDCLHSVSHFA